MARVRKGERHMLLSRKGTGLLPICPIRMEAGQGEECTHLSLRHLARASTPTGFTLQATLLLPKTHQVSAARPPAEH